MEDRQKVVKNFCADSELAHFWLFFTRIPADPLLYVLTLLPMPDFMKGQSIGGMLGNAGSTILWFADVFKVGPALVMIGAAMVFYLLRRVLTVGIW
ncbi:hypothetical protein F7R02_25890 [Xanthomonas cissicola]|uniref:hypothetical protein n=1 Tax=Xanthomonas cissicola TaxID=86186 RepID=UPI0012488454|nr:hypothetical protein F7R02_25890 [Xanthomonas cissicola]